MNVVNTDHKFASFGRRFFATLIDGLILMLLGFGTQFVLGINPFKYSGGVQDQLLVRSLISYGIAIAYTLIFWVNYDGQTPGKRAMHIKIVKENGEKLDFANAIVRYLSYIISGLVLYIGYLWAAFDSKGQAWHDKIAKTYVVKADDKNPNGIVYVIVALFFIGMVAVFSTAVLISAGNKIKQRNSPSNMALRKLANSEKTMKPETKKLWDKSQDLFKQMRDLQKSGITQAEFESKIKVLNDENISLIKDAIKTDPENAQLWTQLGAAYTWWSSKGLLNDSYLAYRKALELEPNNVVYSNNVGDALIALGKYDEAILVLDNSVRIDPRSGFTYESLGKAYEHLKIYDQARKNYQIALDNFEAENSQGKFDSEILGLQKALARVGKI